MKIIYIKLINFSAIYAAKGLYEFDLSFENVDKPIIQIYGKNRCGKTILMHQLHPFSSINLNGDERNDLSLILSGEVGIKNIVYEMNGEVYSITHTYTPTKNSHSVSSSLIHNDKELNPSGGVTVFNNLIEKIMGINKYIFQFVINGTQLTSFSNMNTSQRKQLLNKAMGIDIYDKINKLATEDYRYTNKLISSLNNTKEYILSSYGSYDNLNNLLSDKMKIRDELTQNINITKSKLDSLSGKISVIKQQNVHQEMIDVTNQISIYDNTIKSIGNFDENRFDKLIDEQILLSNALSELRNKRLMIMKDVDILYAKKTEIENDKRINQQTLYDYDNMVSLSEELKRNISDIHINIAVSSSSNYLCSMMSLAQTINSVGKEILTCLNGKHLKLFTEMIINNIDVSAFLIKEGNVLMDSDKERSVISRIRSLINSIDGTYIDEDCPFIDRCIYKRTRDTLDTYFKTYQSTDANMFTQYDIEQFDHAYKNIQIIARMMNVDISEELTSLFSIDSMMLNLCNNKYCIDISDIQTLIEEAGKIEQRNRYITQLSNVEKQISDMKQIIDNIRGSDDIDVPASLQTQIDTYQSQISDIDVEINELNSNLNVNEQNRHLLSQIKNINIKELRARYDKLNKLAMTLDSSENEHARLNSEYVNMSNQLLVVSNEYDTLQHTNTQYLNTVDEINKYLLSDNKYKIIAESTSSTKGKPVLEIRDKMSEVLMITNRLLNVMYGGEIEMLPSTINETVFDLPFRSGCNTSPDIRYGSQSESTLLSLALSLALSSSLTQYNIPLIDEVDAYLDGMMRDDYILMIQEIMSIFKIEQLFIISHNISCGQYEHIVYTQDISNK